MAEWSIAAVLKTVVPARAPGVRIPLSPPKTCCDFCAAGFSVLRTAAQSSVRDVRKTEKRYSAGEKSQQVFGPPPLGIMPTEGRHNPGGGCGFVCECGCGKDKGLNQ